MLAVRQPDLAAPDDPAQLLGQRCSGVRVRLRQDDQELLAAVAAGEVHGPDAGVQELRHVPQDDISRGVAVGVVEPLELVEVDEDHGQRPVSSARRG